jgi:capsid portal protein
MEAFTFGEPVPVLDKREILDYVECIDNGQWYEPPLSFSGLAKSMRAAVHHSSPMYVKRNILVSTFIPHERLSRQDFSRFALDYIVFGNAFIERRLSLSGRPVKYETSPAKYTPGRGGGHLLVYSEFHSRTRSRRFGVPPAGA